jgi:hypothetical protein
MLPYRDGRLGKIALGVFFILLLGYAYYEARAMLYGPQIDVPAATIVVSEPFTEIRGQAHYISELRLNGAVVTVTEEGYFKEPYMLTPGANQIVLDARDRFGRTRQETIEIFYTPKEQEAPAKSASTSTSSFIEMPQ